jgi:hypothetical protein
MVAQIAPCDDGINSSLFADSVDKDPMIGYFCQPISRSLLCALALEQKHGVSAD